MHSEIILSLRYLKCKSVLIYYVVVAGLGMLCYCSGHCPGDDENGTCLARAGSHCFAAVREVYNPETHSFEPEHTFGCLPPHERGLLQVT
jgi:bone morphogenetic protein receptor type-1B